MKANGGAWVNDNGLSLMAERSTLRLNKALRSRFESGRPWLNQSNTNGECRSDRPQGGQDETRLHAVRVFSEAPISASPGATFSSDHANVACAARGMNSTPRGNLFGGAAWQ